MGLFEWFFERKNPGPKGDAEWGIQPNPVGEMASWLKILYFFFGGGFWVFYFFLFTKGDDGMDAFYLLLWGGIYLALCLFVHPRPKHNNLGWAGGLIDNPFRWSDDVNRFLLFFDAFLIPGKLMILFFRIIFFYFSPR